MIHPNAIIQNSILQTLPLRPRIRQETGAASLAPGIDDFEFWRVGRRLAGFDDCRVAAALALHRLPIAL
jgi:hypothetical protein